MLDKSKDVQIQHLAESALDQAKQDVLAATAIMVEHIQGDDTLYHLLMDKLLRTACYDVIAALCRQRNQVIWETPRRTAAEEAKSVSAAASAAKHALMNTILPDGVRLGDALKEDVEAHADFYLKQGKTMLVKGQWLTLIAKAMDGHTKTPVKKILTETKLQNLRDKVQKEFSL